MTQIVNDLCQPIGPPLPGWTPPPTPPLTALEGQYCRLEPLDSLRHPAELWEAIGEEPDERSWTYLPYGPFRAFEEYRLWIVEAAASRDPLFFAIRDRATGRACGLASYLRIAPASGCIEVGHLYFAPSLRRTAAATEAMYLMMEQAFDLGYRRYEWKCDALNAPSRAAAERLGFTFEGTFRQATVYKGRNRDTAWYSIIDSEWPGIRSAFQQWLDPGNFDTSGKQKLALHQCGTDQTSNNNFAANTCLEP